MYTWLHNILPHKEKTHFRSRSATFFCPGKYKFSDLRIDFIGKSLNSCLVWLWFYIGKVCWKTWITLHFCTVISDIRASEIQKCKDLPFLQKLDCVCCWSEVSIGELFLNMQKKIKNKKISICGKSVQMTRGSLNIPYLKNPVENTASSLVKMLISRDQLNKSN